MNKQPIFDKSQVKRKSKDQKFYRYLKTRYCDLEPGEIVVLRKEIFNFSYDIYRSVGTGQNGMVEKHNVILLHI
jgi:hypothetical protein